MAGSEYSPFKCFHHLGALKADRPVLCYWLITHRCVYDCPVCINKHMPRFEFIDELPLDMAIRTAEQLKDLGVKALSISGGEPLFHRNFVDLADALLDMGFEIGLITNGALLDSFNVNRLKRFVWVRISVNSMSRDSFNAVHGKIGEPAIWETIDRFLPELKSEGCVVGSSFLVQPANVHEIAEFAEWSKNVGFHTCRYSYVCKPDGTLIFSESFRHKVNSLTGEAVKYGDDDFRVLALSDRLTLSKTKNYTHCYTSDLTVTVCANGQVYRCCALQNTDIGYLGDLHDQTLEEIWNNRGEQDVATCPMCWQTKKNEFLEYVMSPDPRHVNFV